MEKIRRASLYLFFGLLVYMPLHIFLSTWLGTTFGVLEFAKVFKDIVLFAGFLMIFAASVREAWFKTFFKDRLVWLIAGYALLTVLLALIKPTDQEAETLAVVYNLRFLLFFVYALLLSRFYKGQWLVRKAMQTVLAVGLVVMVFGAVQYLWLPDSALRHVGYNRSNGVLPVFYIDEKPDLERIMSTVRDPNSYGAYLLIIMAIATSVWLWNKNKDLRKMMLGFLGLAVMNLYFTFSRSAWIGAVLTVPVVLIMYAKYKKGFNVSRKIWLPAAALLLILLGSAYAARDTYFVKNVVLHSDESTVMEDPNELRIRFFRESLQASAENPLGFGPGRAGIVSIRNDEQGVLLTENYYLQILYETGVVGLILFVGILVTVAWRLYRLGGAWAATALLAAFVGIAASNVLNHVWTVEAVAYTWWGLAGLVLARGNTHNKKPVKN